VARLNSRALDRSRPLWELYVIEGLDNVEGIPPGSFAFVSKTHHAAIDGATNNDVGTAMCDLTPEIRQVDGAEDWQADQAPTPFELSSMAFQHNLTRPLRYLEFLQKSVPAWSKALEAAASGTLTPPPTVPRTRFNKGDRQ
jgi:hypothetical protein